MGEMGEMGSTKGDDNERGCWEDKNNGILEVAAVDDEAAAVVDDEAAAAAETETETETETGFDLVPFEETNSSLA